MGVRWPGQAAMLGAFGLVQSIGVSRGLPPLQVAGGFLVSLLCLPVVATLMVSASWSAAGRSYYGRRGSCQPGVVSRC